MGLKSILFCFLAVIVGIPHSNTAAQGAEEKVLHFVVSNGGYSELWEYRLQSGQAGMLFRLAPNEQTSTVRTFPPQEVAAIQRAIEYGRFSQQTLDTAPVVRRIQGAWMLDQDRFLLLLSIQVCDHYFYDACFGYHEFALLAPDSGTLSVLTHIGFHEPFFEVWTECTVLFPSVTIAVEGVFPNPTQDSFAVTLVPSSDCLTPFPKTHALIVNYSALPPSRIDFPQARGFSWSPSGLRAAYYHLESCSVTGCDTAITVAAAVNSFEVSDPIRQAYLPYNLNHLSAWFNEDVLYYQWLNSSTQQGDSGENVIMHHAQDISTPIPVLSQFVGIFPLNPMSTTVVTLSSDRRLAFANRVQGFSASQVLSTGRAQINTRFPHQILVLPDQAPSEVILIDVGFVPTTIHLSELNLPFEWQHLVFVSSGIR